MRLRALEIVKGAFANKTDKNGQPYINHLLRVAGNFENEKLHTIALLHDLIEDCPEWTIERLREDFPERIVGVVDILTKRPQEVYEKYILRVSQNQDAILVKLSDLKDNMDLTRITVGLNEREIKRTVKYHTAYIFLQKQLS